MGTAEDAERGLDGCARALVGEDGGVGNLLDQAGTEHGRRDPEDDVAGRELPIEIRLRNPAPGGVAAVVDAAADHEERVHAAVRRAVGMALEAHLADRAVEREKRRDRVARPERGRHRDLRIRGRARATHRRLAVTPPTAVEVETRPEALAETVRLLEFGLADVEEGQLRRRETVQRRAR